MKKLTTDQLGMCLSALCILHCIAAPLLLLLAIGGLFTQFFTSEWLHVVLLFPMTLLVYSSTMRTAIQCQYRKPIMLASLGLFLLLLSLIFEAYIEFSLTIIGGLLIFSGHWLNARFLKRQQRFVR